MDVVLFLLLVVLVLYRSWLCVSGRIFEFLADDYNNNNSRRWDGGQKLCIMVKKERQTAADDITQHVFNMQ